ncbi:hypothetical protein [Salinivirga cyanobacteriivorans]
MHLTKSLSRRNLITIFILLFSLSTMNLEAQRKKRTHDFEKFAKKVVLYMNTDVAHWSPDEEALQYISEQTGKDLATVKAQAKKDKAQVVADVKFLNDNGVYRKLESSDIEVIQEKPVKKANVILHCSYKDKKFDLTLTNCVQTNTTWVLGDGVVPSGDGVQELIEKDKERRKKSESGALAKLQKWGAEQESESTGSESNAYKAQTFQMKGADPVTQYIRKENIGKHLKGYYIDNDNVKHKAVIKYQPPENLSNPNSTLLLYEKAIGEPGYTADETQNRLTGTINKSKIKAFYVGGQLYIFTGEFWDILKEEGAIRKLARITLAEKDGQTNYVLANLIQKKGSSPENTASLMLGFKRKMSALVSENEAMAEKIEDKDDGYKWKNMDAIITEYNQWYAKKYPEKTNYILQDLKEANTKPSPDKNKPVQILTVNQLSDYLGGKTWETTKITQFNDRNPDGISRSSNLKQARVYFTHTFNADGSVVIDGVSPYKGKYDQWKASGRYKITLTNSSTGKETDYKLSNTKTGSFEFERTNPLLKKKEIITFSIK